MRLLALLLVSVRTTSACTAFVAGRLATANGATLLLHTDDCLDCDFRIARVAPLSASAAARPQAVRPFRETYPREVSARSPTYSVGNLEADLPQALRSTWASEEWAANNTIGELPALPAAVAAALGTVDGTLGTLEGLYSIANSRQVRRLRS